MARAVITFTTPGEAGAALAVSYNVPEELAATIESGLIGDLGLSPIRTDRYNADAVRLAGLLVDGMSDG